MNSMISNNNLTTKHLAIVLLGQFVFMLAVTTAKDLKFKANASKQT